MCARDAYAAKLLKQRKVIENSIKTCAERGSRASDSLTTAHCVLYVAENGYILLVECLSLALSFLVCTLSSQSGPG